MKMSLVCFILFVFSWKQTEQLNKPHKRQTDIPDMFLPSSHIGDHCKLTIVKNAQWVRTQQNACFICVPSLSSRKIIYILPGYVEIQIGVVPNFSACTQWSWDVDQRRKPFSESEKINTWISVSGFNFFQVVRIEKQIHSFVFWEKLRLDSFVSRSTDL